MSGWQALYEELAGEGLEIVAVAQDSGGEAAVGPHLDAAGATFTTLLDPFHTVTALYGMVNVPSGVWIDEQGRIVRPPEVAYSRRYEFGSIVAGDDRYAAGLADWARRGAASPFAQGRERVRARVGARDPERALADVHFRLAVALHARGRAAEAADHWTAAQALAPDNWNYHRQAWVHDPDSRAERFRAKLESLEGAPYYAPAELPNE